ncbi:hypothetical protein CHS0354_029700 [Potamilus streckersoni]|uniref:Large ribosomal subunit protein mL42 n=1 Tax=Potamilus streckersoni TaxID=2493646 RepID=A0AAE0RTU0_9BIVA|nr:hypothetical protein CHS0354_029700 [Potamilus streckersoni]
MAAFMQQVTALSEIRLLNFLKRTIDCTRYISYRQVSSSSSGNDNRFGGHREPLVGLSVDGSTVICWHPELTFPYEHTWPVPRYDPEIREGDSVLRVQLLKEDKMKYHQTGPTDVELANMFFTTKHRWYPKPEKMYRKRNPPKDRDGL